MPLTPDQERWAEALAVQKHYGEQAAKHVASRIDALADAEDLEGVRRWNEIGARLARLRRTGAPH